MPPKRPNDREELVYSTSGGRQKPAPAKASPGKSEGPCKMRLEKKGRGGKQVTVLFNLPMAADEAKAWMRQLQEALGCGATFKDGTIELRGDARDRVEAHCQQAGIKILRAGG